MSLEEELVDKAISTNFDDLPSEVVMACKKSVVDLIGVAIAGSTTPVAKKLFEVISQWQGKPESSIFLHNMAIPAHDAVFVNAAMARALDFNQYHFSTGTQPPPTMVPVALATALTGKTPLYGMHLPENRYGQALIELKDDLDPGAFTYADYNALSYGVGKMVVDKIPVFLGLPQNMSITQLKYLCAPLGVSAGIPMFHAVGITPEAPTVEAALGGRKPEMSIEVGRKEINQAFEELCSATELKINYVFLGCPHVTIPEMKEIATLLQGKKIKSDVLLVVGITEPLRLLAREMGLVDIIENSGGMVVSGMCSAGSFLRRGVPEGFHVGVVATNAAKAAHYLKAGEVQVWSETMPECINAAVTGKWEAA